MKAYLIITGILFGVLTVAHAFKTVADWPRLTIEGPGIGVLALALCLWAFLLLRPSARA